MNNCLPVVHIVDAEGVLREQSKITYHRIYEMFGVRIKPTRTNLNKILNRQINLPFNNLIKKEFYKVYEAIKICIKFYTIKTRRIWLCNP